LGTTEWGKHSGTKNGRSPEKRAILGISCEKGLKTTFRNQKKKKKKKSSRERGKYPAYPQSKRRLVRDAKRTRAVPARSTPAGNGKDNKNGWTSRLNTGKKTTAGRTKGERNPNCHEERKEEKARNSNSTPGEEKDEKKKVSRGKAGRPADQSNGQRNAVMRKKSGETAPKERKTAGQKALDQGGRERESSIMGKETGSEPYINHDTRGGRLCQKKKRGPQPMESKSHPRTGTHQSVTSLPK